MRHGQSEWNRDNRFTGWEDPSLTEQGLSEARETARKMRDAGFVFDSAFVSYLRRAAETLHSIQREMDLMWLPIASDWRLNERHYGELQGKNKAETAAEFGAKKVREWRRSYDIRPPQGGELRAADHRYAAAEIPRGESLADTRARAVACYEERIAPLLREKRRILVVAHGNSLRALVMHLSGISPADVMQLEIPTGGATIYYADDNGVPHPPHVFIK